MHEVQIKFSKKELNVLMFSLNNMSLIDESQFELNGVSVGTLYNKIYTAWESIPTGLTD